MKLRLALASASLLVLGACANQEAMQALTAMQLSDGVNSPIGVNYKSRTASGDGFTLNDVTFGAPAVAPATPPAEPVGPPEVLKAKSMTLSGLKMSKDGKPIVGSIVVSGMAPEMEPGGPTVQIGSIGIEGLNPAAGQFLASTFTKEGPGEVPPFAQWEFKKASVKGITVAGPIPQDEAPPGSVNISLDEISLSNLKNTVLGLARFGALKGDVNVPGMPPVSGTFDFGTVDVSNFRAGLIANAVEQGVSSAMTGTSPDIVKMLEGWTSPLDPFYDKSTWSGAKANLSGIKFDATKFDHVIKRDKDGVAIASDSPRWTMALTADSAGGTLGAMGLMVLAMAGYPSNAIELYGEGHATFDPAKDLTHWDNYNFGITDAVDLKISGGLLGLKTAMPTLVTGIVGGMQSIMDVMPQAEEGQPAPEVDPNAVQSAATGMAMGLMMGLIGLQVTDLDIAITDKALMNFIFTQTAMSSGQSVAAYRNDLAAMVTSAAGDIAAAGIDPEMANEFASALAGFLKGPGTLRIQLKPKNPIGMMSVMMAPPTKESLGFSASFTPAN